MAFQVTTSACKTLIILKVTRTEIQKLEYKLIKSLITSIYIGVLLVLAKRIILLPSADGFAMKDAISG